MWPFQKKEQPPQLVAEEEKETGNGEYEFSRVAEEATAGEPETPDTETPAEEGGERFLIRREWAGAVVEGCFWPFARYDHPAWKLAPEETDSIAPKMEGFLQAVVDRYAPHWLGSLATKHAELFDLGTALAMMYYVKFQQVREARAEEAARRAIPAKVTDIHTRESMAKQEFCEICEQTFPSYKELGAHLPCKGKGTPVA